MTFTILFAGGLAKTARRRHPEWPTEVPWAMIAATAPVVLERYGVSVDALASEGLPPCELASLLSGSPPNSHLGKGVEDCMAEVVALIAEHEDDVAAMRKALLADESVAGE